MLTAQTELLATVRDSSGQTLTGANLIILHAQDSLLADFAVSDGAGRVRVKQLAAGDYLLRCTFLGYVRPDEIITIAAEDQLLDLGDLVMFPDSYYLEMASVTGRRIPIRMRGDTMVYDAASFAVREGAAVEELLRRLPGLSVDAVGQIEYQGRPVREVMIDGQPFFANNPTLLTRELPALAVDEVAVYDQQSDAEAVSGQSDGQEYLTVDLALTDDFQSEWFGRLRVGAGTNRRFRADGNLFRIGRKNRLGLVVRSNNLNEIDNPLAAFDQYRQSMTGPGAQEVVRGDNRILGTGWQYGSPLGKHGRLSISGSLTDRRNELLNDRLEQYQESFNPDRIQVLDTALQRPFGAAVELDYRYRRDTSLRWRLGVSYRPQRERDQNYQFTQADFLGDDLYSFGRRDEQDQWLDQVRADWSYVRRLGKVGKLLSVNSNWQWQADRDQWSAQWNRRINCPVSTCGSTNSPAQLNDFASRYRDLIQNTNLEFQLPLSKGWNWEIGGQISSAIGLATTTETAAESGEEEDRLLERNWQTVGPQSSLVHQWNSNRFSVGLGYRTAQQTLNFNGERKQRLHYWTPELQVRILDGRMNYNTIASVQPNWPRMEALLANPRPAANGRVRRSNLELRPELRHQIQQTINYSDYFREINFFLTIAGAYVSDAMASSLEQEDGLLIDQLINVSHAWDYNWSLGGSVRPPILFDRLEINYRNIARIGQVVQLGELQELRAEFREAELSLVKNWSEAGFVELGVSHRRQRNELRSTAEPIFFNRLRLSAQLERQLSNRLETGARLIFDRLSSSGTEKDWLNQTELWLQWKVWSDREHLLRLQVGDVFNQNQLVNRQNASFALIEERTNSLGRYALLSLNVKF